MQDKRQPVPFLGSKTTGAEYDALWEVLWRKGVEMGQMWDVAGPHKALIDLLERKVVDVNGKTVVVPGCGRGYDAIALSEKGGKVTGLEIAESGVFAAKAYLEQYNRERQTNVSVTYTTVNFFEHQRTYDVGYDYTFLCAIHPDQHQQWGQKWAELIRPGGNLVTILFPIVPERVGGPPWHVDPSIATEMLSDNFELLSEGAVPEELSDRMRVGREVAMLKNGQPPNDINFAAPRSCVFADLTFFYPFLFLANIPYWTELDAATSAQLPEVTSREEIECGTEKRDLLDIFFLDGDENKAGRIRCLAWDMAGQHKALERILADGRVDVQNKKVLVPGCGRGYDAILLAERGGDVEGLDISASGTHQANAHLDAHNSEKGSNVAVTYTTTDFFGHTGTYSVGYDYTFLCAIHPDLRQQWGKKWMELLESGGILLIIVFPIMPGKTTGHPWHIDQAIVTELLGDNFELLFEEKVSDALSEAKRAGHEVVMIWKRK